MSTVITIDAAGRLVLPKRIRDQYGLGPGSEIELEDTGTDIRLRPVLADQAPLEEVHGFLVYTGRFSEDTATAIQQDREARLRHVGGT